MQELNLKLLNVIKQKSQISGLSDDYVLDKIEKYFLRNGDKHKLLKQNFEKTKNKIEKNKLFKEVVKDIREEIGVIYGSFLTKDFKKKNRLLNKEGNFRELLMLHKSTRERLEFYEKIYNKIFAWKKPEKIGDLGCGLNPVSHFIMKDILGYDVSYFASDLNPEDMNFLNDFFKRYEIEGIAKAYDLTTLEIAEDLDFKSCDMVFLFKALDSLEYVKKNVSKELLKMMPTKNIVVSFPTKSLVSKQEFKIEKRNWFINFLNKQGWEYETFEVENELFFLIEK